MRCHGASLGGAANQLVAGREPFDQAAVGDALLAIQLKGMQPPDKNTPAPKSRATAACRGTSAREGRCPGPARGTPSTSIRSPS
jgi:hypothetical protein